MCLIKNITLCIFLFGCNSSNQQKDKETFIAYLRHIPDSLDPHLNQNNTTHYVLLQMYYPLFRKLSNSNFESNFLDMNLTRAINKEFSAYRFCLIKNIHYNNNQIILIKDLLNTVLQSHNSQETFPELDKILIEDNECLLIKLQSNDPYYLSRFTSVSSTIISSESKNSKIPIGLGAYSIKSQNEDMIELERKQKEKNRINKIIFKRFISEDDLYKQSKIDDVNHVFGIKVDHKKFDDYQKIDAPYKKVYSVVMNIENKELRKQIVDCFDVEDFRKHLIYKLEKTNGFLPKGVYGTNVSLFTDVRTKSCKIKKSNPLKFYVYDENLNKKLNNYFSDKHNSIARNFDVKLVKIDEFIKHVFERKPYVGIIGFDSSGSQSSIDREAAVFFETFIREKSLIISKPIKGLDKIVRLAAAETDESIKEKLYQDAHRLLLSQYYLIPLGQLEDYRLYPKYLRNIVWGDRVSGIPNVEQITIEND